MKLCFFLIVFALSACATKPKPFLYRASNQWRDFLIFGTLHRGVTEEDLSPVVRTALAGADHAYFEFDWRQDPKQSALRLMIRSGEPTLDQRLPPAEFAFLDAAVAKVAPGLSPDRRKSLRPFMALTLLQSTRKVQLASEVALKYAPENSMEPALVHEAERLHTPIVILEDPNREVCADEIDRDSLSKIRKIFAGQSAEADFDETEALARAYRSGNPERVLKAAQPVENACLQKDRNQRWASIFSQMGGLGFVAVDVGQLVPLQGQPSLLSLLEAKGFTLQRLSPPPGFKK